MAKQSCNVNASRKFDLLGSGVVVVSTEVVTVLAPVTTVVGSVKWKWDVM